MSAQVPPNPILTTYQYWNWVNVDEATRRQRALDNNYMTIPTAQNYPTFFSKLFLVTDVALTKMANTAYVIANLVPYLVSLPPLITSTTWLALQNFTGIETNTINPITTSGTLTIGSGVDHNIRIASQNGRDVVLHLGDGASATSGAGIHIGNGANSLGNVNILNGVGSTGTITLGTRRTVPSVSTTTTTLNCPLTQSFTSYPIASNNIGFSIPTTTFINDTLSSGGSSFSVRSISIPTDGIWALYGEFLGTGTVAPFPQPGTFYGISFTTGTNGTGTFIGQQKTGQQIPPTTNIFSATYFVIARLTAGIIYLNGRSQTTYTLGSSQIISIRLA